jgi:hypothetical protein
VTCCRDVAAASDQIIARVINMFATDRDGFSANNGLERNSAGGLYISFRLVVLVATLIPLRAIARSALHALISNTP